VPQPNIRYARTHIVQRDIRYGQIFFKHDFILIVVYIFQYVKLYSQYRS